VVIIAAIKRLRVGQCASHFAREKPSIVVELYEVIQKYKSDDDYKKESRKKTTLGLKSSKATITSILQDQTTMSEDHLHRSTKSIKSRMTTIQLLKVIMLTKINTISEVNMMKEHLKEKALPQEKEEEEKEEEHL